MIPNCYTCPLCKARPNQRFTCDPCWHFFYPGRADDEAWTWVVGPEDMHAGSFPPLVHIRIQTLVFQHPGLHKTLESAHALGGYSACYRLLQELEPR